MHRAIIHGAIVLIVLLLAAFFAWKYWTKGHCSADIDCKAPDTCQNGKCAPPTACTSTQLANLKMMPVNGIPPGACAPSVDGKWLLFPNAWFPNGTNIVGSPTGHLSSAADCQAFCAAAPTCTSWAYHPVGDTNCRAYSTVPTAVKGDPTWVGGVSARALGP